MRPSIYFIINLFHPARPICIKTYAIIPLHGYIIYSGRTSACANTLTTQFRNGRTANGYKSLTIITLWELRVPKVNSLSIFHGVYRYVYSNKYATAKQTCDVKSTEPKCQLDLCMYVEVIICKGRFTLANRTANDEGRWLSSALSNRQHMYIF
jgi:hypothetical protein